MHTCLPQPPPPPPPPPAASPHPPLLFPLVPSATGEPPGFINVRHYRFSRGIAFYFYLYLRDTARSIIAARKYGSARPVVFSTSAIPCRRRRALLPPHPALSRRGMLFPLKSPDNSPPCLTPSRVSLTPLSPCSFNPRRRPHGFPRDFELCYSSPRLSSASFSST